MTLQKVNNHTTKKLSDSEMDEITNIELRGMNKEIKEDLNKHLNDSKRIQVIS
jgi:hypothetical protein